MFVPHLGPAVPPEASFRGSPRLTASNADVSPETLIPHPKDVCFLIASLFCLSSQCRLLFSSVQRKI